MNKMIPGSKGYTLRKWACTLSNVCLYDPPKHEYAAVFPKKTSEIRMFLDFREYEVRRKSWYHCFKVGGKYF